MEYKFRKDEKDIVDIIRKDPTTKPGTLINLLVCLAQLRLPVVCFLLPALNFVKCTFLRESRYTYPL